MNRSLPRFGDFLPVSESFSGGAPLMQMDFFDELLSKLILVQALIFVSTALPQEKFRQIAPRISLIFSYLHLYGKCNLPLWAMEGLLSRHSAESVKRTFCLKRKAAAVVELFFGKTVVEHTAEFDYEFDGPETVLFQLLPE